MALDLETLKLKIRKLLVPVIATIGVLLVAFAAAEFGCRLYFADHLDPDMEMWRYSRTLKVRVPELRSHAHRANAYANLMGVTVRLNSLGDRGPEMAVKERKRLIAIGDEDTLGWGVSEEETFCSLLERQTPYEVVNTGVGNYNLEQIADAYERHGKTLGGDIVIYFFTIDDAQPVQVENPGGSLYSVAFAKSFFRNAFGKKKDEVAAHIAEFEGASADRLQVQMERLRVSVGQLPFVVVLLPDFKDLEHAPYASVHNKLKNFWGNEGLKIVDLLPIFQGRRSRDFWVAPNDPRPNATAHAIIADEIAKYIKTLELE